MKFLITSLEGLFFSFLLRDIGRIELEFKNSQSSQIEGLTKEKPKVFGAIRKITKTHDRSKRCKMKETKRETVPPLTGRNTKAIVLSQNLQSFFTLIHIHSQTYIPYNRFRVMPEKETYTKK